MTVPTVPVTVRLADFGGQSIGGIVVTARLSDVDYTPDGTFVSTEPVTATTNDAGVAILNLFPNAVSPSGLGTRGTIVRVKATMPDSRKLQVLAVIPNEAVSLSACVVSQEVTGLDASQQAAADAQAARNLAKKWATQTTAEVEAGQGYGAKKYADDAAAAGQAVSHIYPGVYAVNPTTRPDGSPIQEGDRFAKNDDNEYVRINGAWTSAAIASQTAFLASQAASASASLSQDWATKTASEVVVGQGFGAKKYSNDAATQAAAAAASKTAAQTSETNAGNYATAAATGAKFFDTIALGNAGVADGATFGVKAGGADGLTRPTVYRRDSAGNSTLLYAVLRAAEYDALFPSLAPMGYAFAFVDPDGVASLAVRTDGTTEIAKLSMPSLRIAQVGTTNALLQDVILPGYSFALMDADGLGAFGIKSDGTAVAGAMEARTLNGVSVAQIISGAIAGASGSSASALGNFDAEVNGFDSYGQSKANGTAATPLITTAQAYDTLKFNGGVRATDGGGTAAANHASLVPLTETSIVAGGFTNGETPVAGTTDYIKQRIVTKYSLAYTQQAYQLLGSSAGAGGTPIAGLINGTGPFQDLKDNIAYGYSLSQAAGKTYKFRAFGWSQGESDYINNTAGATYEAQLIQLRTDVDTYAKSVTGQADSVACIISQVGAQDTYGHPNDPYLALRQLKITKEQAHFYMACPVYFLPTNGYPHFSGTGSKWLGAYYGRVYTRVIVEGSTWKPLQPLSAYRQGNVAVVRMNVPTPPLVFDTFNVAAQANRGFTLADASNVAIAISSVSIIEKDTVKIVAAAPIPAGAKLRYGFIQAGGNLRDSDAETFDVGGVQKPLYNWCVIFEETLA